MSWIGAAIVVVILLIVAFSGGESPSSTSTLPNPNTLGDKEKYAMFEAEVACRLMATIGGGETEPEEFISGTLKVVSEVSDKYGYTIAEVEAKKNEYADIAKILIFLSARAWDIFDRKPTSSSGKAMSKVSILQFLSTLIAASSLIFAWSIITVISFKS